MQQEHESVFKTDADGNPAGGKSYAVGVEIEWQNGPLGRGAERVEPNGAFVETVIEIAKTRLEFYQQSKFACTENAVAIEHLELALVTLRRRTDRRERQGIEGTHDPDPQRVV